MPYYNKDILKQQLNIEQVYDLLVEWGGEPIYSDNGLISQTICHNPPGEGSYKLYYYANSNLFYCYSGCEDPSFDIFELAKKVAKIQFHRDWELYEAMDYIARYFGFEGIKQEDEQKLRDWEILARYNFESPKPQEICLKEYDSLILTRFAHPRILNWEQEGISYETCLHNQIGYYPGGEQITIPHFDINNRLVGIRGRALSQEMAERYGKYRPLYINKVQYSHPLSMNLYNLNNSWENIAETHIAVIFESEKSCMQYQTIYGFDNDISIACCGSNISSFQINLLLELGVTDLVVAFDRQYEVFNSKECEKWTKKLESIYKKYGKLIHLSFIFDQDDKLPYKASPIDMGKDTFEYLLKKRIYL